jgi:mannose-6-phosphate isomerase
MTDPRGPAAGGAGRSGPAGGAGGAAEAGAHQPERVEKPWGHELIWARTGEYVGKILHVRAGHALSLQYHEAKDETIHLLRGRMRFEVGQDAGSLEVVELGEGQSFRIPPGTVHRMTALTDVDILEASTPQLDDVVRLEDRYGRT